MELKDCIRITTSDDQPGTAAGLATSSAAGTAASLANSLATGLATSSSPVLATLSAPFLATCSAPLATSSTRALRNDGGDQWYSELAGSQVMLIEELHGRVGSALATARSGNFSDDARASISAMYQAKLTSLCLKQIALVKEVVEDLGTRIFLEDAPFWSAILDCLSQRPEFQQIDSALAHIQLMVLLLKKMGILTKTGDPVLLNVQ
ncbi:hypothetical protein PtA15_17A113 [Puccinia triticina]|uniref:Uncharacterized protein n=1 Tax=Puccinia triticina TaxID=208348 RepID=A0ABY7D4T8_9BASI|nr:uncharacterized protein PtA15_17A113 [Puccinia triticina]WAQ92631.1 hypothetical protein PtA15_17A113 [Puccinia triticina]